MLYYLANGARERDQSAAGDRIQGEAAIEKLVDTLVSSFSMHTLFARSRERERERGTGRARIDKPQPESAIASTVRS